MKGKFQIIKYRFLRNKGYVEENGGLVTRRTRGHEMVFLL